MSETIGSILRACVQKGGPVLRGERRKGSRFCQACGYRAEIHPALADAIEPVPYRYDLFEAHCEPLE